ncbi:hypothetical protein HID58_086772, partial [Brassica napus]
WPSQKDNKSWLSSASVSVLTARGTTVLLRWKRRSLRQNPKQGARRSHPLEAIVTALIEELEKLRLPPSPPPSAAGSEEINLPAKKNKKKKERKEEAEEEKVTEKDVTDPEGCKISDGLDAGEVSKDNISPCSVSSQDGTTSPPPATNGKPRRKRNKAKKPQTSN